MNSYLVKTIVVILAILLPYLCSTEAIYCWQCNSAVDRFCKDVPSGPMQDPDNLDDCYKKMYKECIADKINYTFCRKQVQTIDKESRVIRSCGFIPAQQDCYWTRSPPAATLVCQCHDDGCNSALFHTLSPILAIALFLFSLFWVRFLAK